jgi:hypothetical protein
MSKARLCIRNGVIKGPSLIGESETIVIWYSTIRTKAVKKGIYVCMKYWYWIMKSVKMQTENTKKNAIESKVKTFTKIICSLYFLNYLRYINNISTVSNSDIYKVRVIN